jgi:hypothetical protein
MVILFTKHNYAVGLRVCLSPIVELPLDVSHLLWTLCSNQNMKDVVRQGTEHDSRVVRFNFESKDQTPSFKDLVRSDASENLEGAEAQIPQESSIQWPSEDSPNLASGLDDANPPYPYLPTVLEEPNSSFSEGITSLYLCSLLPYYLISDSKHHFHEWAVAEDDPLPAIDGLRITGEAFPGREIQASGYSINGTTSCNFEVRVVP